MIEPGDFAREEHIMSTEPMQQPARVLISGASFAGMTTAI